MNNKPRYTLHKANSRGHANHGWLNSYHSFRFCGYYQPDCIQFGALPQDQMADGR
jgi:redox-sensitive bicupin YhaK (pirin superfamily)